MRKSRQVMIGLVCVLIAVALVASQFTSFGEVHIGFWGIIGTIACGLVVSESIVHLRFGVSFMVPLALLYELWYKQLSWPALNIWILLLAALVAGVGIEMITHSLRRNKWRRKFEDWGGSDHIEAVVTEAVESGRDACQSHADWHRSKNGAWRKGESNGGVHLESSGDDDHPVCKVRFGSNSRYLHSEALSTGLFDLAFGQLEVYFDQAKLSNEGARIITNVAFGEIKLYVPADWPIKNNGLSVTMTGGMEGVPLDANTAGPALEIEGSVSFGSLSIERVASQRP
jgi:predicted membrane protein